MVATPLTPSARYFPVALRKIYWVPTIASKAAPSRSELNAGTDITAEVVDGSLSGFRQTASTIDAPDVGNLFTAQVSGRTTAASSSFNVYISKTGTDARSLLTLGLSGFICIFPEGDVTGRTLQVWPVYITSPDPDQDTSKAGQIMVEFAVTSAPAMLVSVP
jgi:hypothetical protein